MLTKAGPHGEPLLAVVNEWVADGVIPYLDDAAMSTCDERDFSAVCSELRSGRSVCLSKSDSAAEYSAGLRRHRHQDQGNRPRFSSPASSSGSSDSDNTRQRRAVDSAELAALETRGPV